MAETDVILTPDQRVRVFISSTLEELAAEYHRRADPEGNEFCLEGAARIEPKADRRPQQVIRLPEACAGCIVADVRGFAEAGRHANRGSQSLHPV
jgi:hypothetical protein